MKKFFAIYLSILCFLPMLANAALCSSTDDPTACVSCVQAGGWYWSDLDSPHCLECPSDQYHTTCTNANDCEATCSPVNPTGHSGYFRSNDGTTRHPCPEPTPHTGSNAQNYNNEVQTYIYQCEAYCSMAPNISWHIIHANDSAHTYFCGTCGAGTMSTGSAPYTCTCISGAHAANGAGAQQCKCPANSTFNNNNNTCECNSGYTHQIYANGTTVTTVGCCPETQVSGGQTVSIATYDATTDSCICDAPGASADYDNNNNLTSCECIPGAAANTDNGYPVCVCQGPSSHRATTIQVSIPGSNQSHTKLDSCDPCSTPQSSTDYNIRDPNKWWPQKCRCNGGYYRNATDNGVQPTCNKCPAGTNSDVGSVGISSCTMSDSTLFCTSDDRCMKLIPADDGSGNITIQGPQETGTTTQQTNHASQS